MAEATLTETQEVETLSHVDEYLKFGQQYDCSDIHLATTAKPSWRRYGTLQAIWENARTLTAEDTEKLASSAAFVWIWWKSSSRNAKISAESTYRTPVQGQSND